MVQSVFAPYRDLAYPFRYQGKLHIAQLVGGIPSDPNIAKAWIESKLSGSTKERIQQLVDETMAERGISQEAAVTEVNKNRNLIGFKRERCPTCPPSGAFCTTGEHPLFWEGRCLKAALKEAVSVAAAAYKVDMTGWGATRKWLTKFMPEHVFIPEKTLYLHQCTCGEEDQAPSYIYEPTGIIQQFVHTPRGQSALQYQEYAEDVDIYFTMITDYEFTPEDMAMIWSTGEQNGVGASRSQGYGTYQVVAWDQTVNQAGVDRMKTRKTKAPANPRAVARAKKLVEEVKAQVGAGDDE